ncbi:hypothetical protein DLAC_07784 [Tieghemostelium lacteum]|uniref:RNB domain-containing protein n=1 Tax=Tieghemostelium lacteum TaxID=361077 RepID=A0A151ZAD5_TIELA|nr:hypothetical protein DLAC_07784 [Tieghemostelium lacteum]|eukprot:KYQ90911.1 hypothetical protein DLAC_07784 [Tieghemostelium lacteum]
MLFSNVIKRTRLLQLKCNSLSTTLRYNNYSTKSSKIKFNGERVAEDNNNDKVIPYIEKMQPSISTETLIEKQEIPNIIKSLSKTEKKLLSQEEKKVRQNENRMLKAMKIKRDKEKMKRENQESKLRIKIESYNQLPPELKILIPNPEIELQKLYHKYDGDKGSDSATSTTVTPVQDPNTPLTKDQINKKQLSILFGKEDEVEVDSEENDQVYSNLVSQVLEYVDEDGAVQIGVIKDDGVNGGFEYTVLQLVRDENGQYKYTIVQVHKLEVISKWKPEYSTSINELINLDTSYQKKIFEHQNQASLNQLHQLKNIFKPNKKLHFTSVEAAKVLYTTLNPTLKEVYQTHKYLSTHPELGKSEDREIGYSFFDVVSENLDNFVKKVKQILQKKHLKDSVNGFEGKRSLMDFLSEDDIYFINCIHQYSMAPFDMFPNKIHRKILKKLNLEVSPKSARGLLINMGFEFNNENTFLYTKELLERVDDIVHHPERYPDPLAGIRREFTLPVIAIDPMSALGIDDAFSVEVDDKFFRIYVHITDLTRWIKYQDILYKSAMISVKSWYLPLGTFHMFPIPFVLHCSLSNNGKTPAHAITLKLNFDKDSQELKNYEIYPTTLPPVTQLSLEQATEFIDQSLHSNEDISPGHTILKDLYSFTQKRSQFRQEIQRNYDRYGRLPTNRSHVRVIELKKTPTVLFKNKFYNKAQELVDEVLSSADDAFSDYFQRNNAYAFYRYRGTMFFQKLTKTSSFVAVTSPLRNFTHLYSQFQLVSLLQDKKLLFQWEDISKIGNNIISSLKLKQYFQSAITNHFLLKLIANHLEKQKESTSKSDPDKKPELVGKVISITESTKTFSIHFPTFKYSANASLSSGVPKTHVPKNKKQQPLSLDNASDATPFTFPFKVGDYVVVTVEYFNLEKQLIQLKFKELIDQSQIVNGDSTNSVNSVDSGSVDKKKKKVK